MCCAGPPQTATSDLHFCLQHTVSCRHISGSGGLSQARPTDAGKCSQSRLKAVSLCRSCIRSVHCIDSQWVILCGRLLLRPSLYVCMMLCRGAFSMLDNIWCAILLHSLLSIGKLQSGMCRVSLLKCARATQHLLLCTGSVQVTCTALRSWHNYARHMQIHSGTCKTGN